MESWRSNDDISDLFASWEDDEMKTITKYPPVGINENGLRNCLTKKNDKMLATLAVALNASEINEF